MMTRSGAERIEAVVAGASGSAGVRAFLDDEDAAGSVAGAVARRLRAHPADVWLRPTRVKLSVDRRLTVTYRAVVNISSGPIEHHVVATWEPPHAEPTVRASPDDRRFPQLGRLVDPHHAADIVERATGVRTACTVHTIRYRPGQRHVLRYDRDDGAPGVIVKLKRDLDAGHAYTVGRAFARWAQRSGDAVATVAPLLHPDRDGAVVTGVVTGTPLSDMLARDHRSPHLVAAGRAFRTLHDAPFAPDLALDDKTFAAVLRATLRAGRAFAVLASDGNERLQHLAAEATRAAAVVPSEPSTVVHGDAKSDHVWSTGSGITLIDIDSCARAEPAYEVGNFLGDLDFVIAANPDARDAAKAAFLAGYGRSLEQWPRARLYEGLALARMAFHRLPLIDADWDERAASMLASATNLLAKVAA